MRRKITSSFLLILIAFTLSPIAPSNHWAVQAEPVRPLVIVIVDSSIYQEIQESLNQYVIDVELSGFSVNVTRTSQLAENTPKGIRAFLQSFENQSLVGAVLIGDVSVTWFETQGHRFPTDMYYMDLNGQWFDMDNDGTFDARGGDLAPEIWVGRMMVSKLTTNPAMVINNYLKKNHAYRNGTLTVPWWRSLIYIDDQGSFNRLDAENSLNYVSADTTLVLDSETTNSTDYKNRLKDPTGFNWLYLMSHGELGKHSFYVLNKTTGELQLEGAVDFNDYERIDPRILFYDFFVCLSSRYTDQNYLAGTAVFETSLGLAAFGSTDDIYTFSMDSFFKSLSEGFTLGEAFKQWMSKVVEQNKINYYTDLRYQILFNDLVLTGDPTLSMIRENHDVAVTEVTVTVKNISETETLTINATVENEGEYDEKVEIEIQYDLRKVFSINTTIRAGESTTVTFSPVNSHDFIWGTHSKHLVTAKATIASGEFNLKNNEGVAYFYGKTAEMQFPFMLPAFILPLIANIILGVVSWLALKQLMSERPRSLLALRKLQRFLIRKKTAISRSQ